MTVFNPASAFYSTSITRRRHLTAGALLVLASTVALPAQAQEPALVGLINAFRGESASCGSGEARSVGPLAPVDALALAPAKSGDQLQEQLQRSSYRPAKLQAISISGPTDAQTAMEALRSHYCAPLRSQDFAEIGVSREGNTWQVLLAKPLLAPDLGEWQQVGKTILQKVNEARAKPRSCGNESFEAAPPLSWNSALGDAALAHSHDMAKQSYFSHQAPDGSQVSDRPRVPGIAGNELAKTSAPGRVRRSRLSPAGSPVPDIAATS